MATDVEIVRAVLHAHQRAMTPPDSGWGNMSYIKGSYDDLPVFQAALAAYRTVQDSPVAGPTAYDLRTVEENLKKNLTVPVERVIAAGANVRVFISPLAHFKDRTVLIDLQKGRFGHGWEAVDDNVFDRFVAAAATGDLR